MGLIDLSHVVEHGMTTYPGLPGPLVCDFLSRADSEAHYAPGTRFQIGKVELVANTGTYVDAPFHRWEEGADLSELALERLADLDALVLRHDPEAPPAIGPELFRGQELRGRAVLVHTEWARHWRSATYGAGGHPYLTAEAAELLVEARAAFVGIDSLNIDDTGDGRRPVHTALLGAGIPIGEHFTNLGALPAEGARLHAVPVKLRGMGTFPVRAYALAP